MTRILALVVGLLLIAAPAWWLRDVTVPLPAYRQAGYASFLFFGQALLAIYGSVLFGIAVRLARARGSPQPVSPFKIFQAGALGALVVCAAFLVGGSVYGLAKYGAFEKAIGGNLWGLLGIFWVILGAIVSAGVALLFYAWRGLAGRSGATPGSSGPGMPRS
ncbi:MAG: hypothetical protein QOD94_384 [Alphaproteobacteria bacterium]|nr:hypothetical protein [Alphaproteobacteria bacterium]